MKVCIISGSARRENITIRVALALQRVLKGLGHHTTVIDFRGYDIPLITQGDIEASAYTPFQQRLVTSMQEAHITILISPEYNWSTTPEILNMLHRLGERQFSHVFNETVFALVGVSSGRGGKAPALHLSSILSKLISFMELESIVSTRIFESHHTRDVLDQEGNSLGNPVFDRGLEAFTNYTLRVAGRWFATTS
jgi:chromate reductase